MPQAHADPYAPVPRENRDLDHIPGDYGWPLAGPLLNTLRFIRDYRYWLGRGYREHGPVFRSSSIFGRALNLIGPDANRFVLLDRDGNFSSYLGWQPSLARLFPRGLMLRDGDDHRYHRRIMQTAFRKKALAGYLEAMNPGIESSLAAWREHPHLLFYPAIKRLTLDLAVRVFLGLQLEEAEVRRVNRAFVDTVKASLALVRVPVPGLAFRRGLRGRELLAEFIGGRIPEKRAGADRDLFSHICQARSEDGEAFTDREIVDHMIFLMMAAHDTTTSSLSTMVYALARHPEWQERLREESRDLGRTYPDFEDLGALESVTRVFREALRLYPPLPTIPRRTVRECEFGGYTLPANTMVTVFPGFTHRMPEWWDEPDAFYPERFSPERAEHRRHPFSWVPFGGGSHMCIGLHFAELQVKAIMHQLLLRYRVSVPAGYEMPYELLPLARPRDNLPIDLQPL